MSERAGALLKSTVSVVTANIASVMVDEEAESDFARLETKIDRLSAKLDEFANQRAG